MAASIPATRSAITKPFVQSAKVVWAVYLAEQIHPVHREVALKVLKRGMESAAIWRRFESERQALALMQHPNIATLQDAGTSAKGRPYFVMEYVDGLPITAACDQRCSTIAERLALFAEVCRAVEYAHRKRRGPSRSQASQCRGHRA